MIGFVLFFGIGCSKTDRSTEPKLVPSSILAAFFARSVLLFFRFLSIAMSFIHVTLFDQALRPRHSGDRRPSSGLTGKVDSESFRERAILGPRSQSDQARVGPATANLQPPETARGPEAPAPRPAGKAATVTGTVMVTVVMTYRRGFAAWPGAEASAGGLTGGPYYARMTVSNFC